MRLPAILLIGALAFTGCRKAMKYEQVKSIPGRVEIAFEVPVGWPRYLNDAGKAKSSWAVEIHHPENRLVTIDINKYATDASRKGFPIKQEARVLADAKALKDAVVGSVSTAKSGSLTYSRFTDTADYIETSGGAGKAPRMKDSNAYFTREGFLYVISYSAPEKDHDKFLPVFEHVLETLNLSST